jgi:four helix bundle protein
MRHAFGNLMNEKAEELKARTAAFAAAVIELIKKIPQTAAGRRIGQQLVDSATSVAANYRAACRARSRREFVAKIGTVLEEADESYGWLKLIGETQLLSADKVQSLSAEAYELTAIFAASHKTAKRNLAPERRRTKSSISE